MKQANTPFVALVATATLMTLGWTAAAEAQYRPVTVQVSPNDDETELVAVTPSQCANSPNPGCVQARVGERLRIQIVLGADEKCSSGGRWALTGVYLGGEDSATKPGSWGGLSKAVNDFDVDAASGRVQTGSNPNALNFTDENTQAYDVWYTVQAECDGRVIELDPRIRNDGRG